MDSTTQSAGVMADAQKPPRQSVLSREMRERVDVYKLRRAAARKAFSECEACPFDAPNRKALLDAAYFADMAEKDAERAIAFGLLLELKEER